MLEWDLTEKRSGVVIWGDIWTLREFHQHILRIVEKSSFIQDKETFLGLAYDIRKAYEGQRRESVRIDSLTHDACRVYGVEVLWPDLVAQVGVLRAAMAWADFSKADQAHMFEMEKVVEEAAVEALIDSRKVEDLMYQMQRIGSYPPAHVWNLLYSRNRYFVERPSEQKTVFILPVLRSLDPLYAMHADRWVDAAVNELVIPIEDFVGDDGEGFPIFEW